MGGFAEEVDKFLSLSKELEPISTWRSEPDGAEWRAFYTISEGGRSTGRHLEMSVWPARPGLNFMLAINFPPAILRINVATGPHWHDNYRPPPDVPLRVTGNRYFLWHDNRDRIRPGQHGRLIARPLDPGLRNWDNALRWLCASARISVVGHSLETYPSRLTLFGPR